MSDAYITAAVMLGFMTPYFTYRLGRIHGINLAKKTWFGKGAA